MTLPSLHRVLAVTALLALVIGAIGAALPGSTLSAVPPVTAPNGNQPTVVTVPAADDATRSALWAAQLDVVDFGDRTAEVWLHGPDDASALAALGLPTTVIDTTMEEMWLDALRQREAAAQDAFESGEGDGSSLPTGRLEYRTLEEINADLFALAEAHPDTAKLIELPHTTLLGKTVYGLEISHDVHTQAGEPVFLMTGVHHAREWPTAEFVTEFAFDVVEGDGTDARVTALLDSTHLVLVPVVNADGYDVSRRGVHEQKRKNCRVNAGEIPTAEQCEAATASAEGVDPNRNYGTFWNGPGSGSSDGQENYRGEAPYSEPETLNVVELTAAHQVNVAIHNHTPDGRLLRAPSSPEEPEPVDVEAYDALAQTLGGILGWPAGPWTEVYYVASGVAEEHAYYTTGIYGFTPENTPGYSGLQRFHPPYQAVIEQYTGTGEYADSHLREAYLTAWEAVTDPAQHSVLTGTATPGATLTLTKDIHVETSCAIPGSVEWLTCPRFPLSDQFILPTDTVSLHLETTMTVPADGVVEWHVQSSDRPSQRTQANIEESWTLTCAGADPMQVRVTRGETLALDLSACSG